MPVKKRPEPAQPDAGEQSGSAGRYTGVDVLTQRKDTGQDRYGQSGFGGKGQETIGQAEYRKSDSGSGPDNKTESNQGSGRADDESKPGEKARLKKRPT